MEDLIYNQNDIPKERWRYGLRSSASVGCGWIATCNVLRLLGRSVNEEKLIREFERQLPLLHGNTGTSFWGPARALRKRGFRTRLTARSSRFDQLAKESDAAILFFYWRQGWKIGAHFAAIRYTPDGFVGYNTFRNSHGPEMYGPSIRQFIRRHRFFGAVLTCIKEEPR